MAADPETPSGIATSQADTEENIVGTPHGFCLSSLPPRRHEAFLEGRTLLQREMCYYTPKLRARATWTAPTEPSEYGLQLREKQKVKRIYGVFERQFRSYFARADRRKGVTGKPSAHTEQRLDSVVYRLVLPAPAPKRASLSVMGHFMVNSRKVDIPSYLVKSGD